MPKVFDVRHEDHLGNAYLYHSRAKICAFDATGETNLSANNTQDAIHEVNEKAEGRATTATLTATIRASAFTGRTAPYVQTINLDGILETDNPMIGVVYDVNATIALKQQEAFSCVGSIKTLNNQLVVYCYEDKPTVDIPIQVKVVR